MSSDKKSGGISNEEFEFQIHTRRQLAKDKTILEVSLVRKRARDSCHVVAYEDALGTQFTRRPRH